MAGQGEDRLRRRSRSRLARRVARLRRGARNAMELLSQGRLGAPYQAPFEVARRGDTYALRRYTVAEARDAARFPCPILFVPPLMVTSEIYDISPEQSATMMLAAQGVDVWLTDFGVPERVDGGLDRTLDDHVLAISACVDHIRADTGRDVHLLGYSQGGMFCYQAAAYRRSEGIRSLVTFGSPVDMRRNLPVPVHETLIERALDVARRLLDRPLGALEGLPGTLTSRGFKLLAPRQEAKHIIKTLRHLDDREALASTEPKRRFLGGEGFIAWPGPAFRTFVDEFVVRNRMKDGGFVIGGRTVSLADLSAPIAYFVGLRDDLARPVSVEAVERVAINARCHRFEVDAGHFGLVIGSQAAAVSWPSVIEWIAWIDQAGPEPAQLAARRAAAAEHAEPPPPPTSAQRLYELATDVADELWERLGGVGLEASAAVAAIRWQLPRMARMASLRPHCRVSYARVLAEQAEAIGDETFFIWRGRAYSYAEADVRVTALAHVLLDRGVRRGHHVGVLMDNHPDYLTLVGAINRLGAVSVLLPAKGAGASLRHGLAAGEVDHLVADGRHYAAAVAAFGPEVMLLGVAPPGGAPAGARHLDPALTHAPGELPANRTPNPGRASDLATLIFTSGTTGLPKAARVTNGRWVAAGLATATTAELTPRDTVYLCLPLYHSTAMMVAVGGALTAGARLALAPRFSASTFWPEVRNVGATVVFYVGELLRYLTQAPADPLDARHPVRLFAGNGLSADVWAQVLARFGRVRILEFYSSTEGNAILANRSGAKIGSVGRELTGLVDTALVRYDPVDGRPIRDQEGYRARCAPGEPGLLVSRIAGDHPLAAFAGYTDARATEAKILRHLFEPGDAWFDTGDVLYADADGDHYFVDRLGDTFRWKGENVSTELVARVVRAAPGIGAAAVYGVQLPGREGRAGVAAVELAGGAPFDGRALYRAVAEDLSPAARPLFVRVVDALDLTASLKVIKYRLQQQGVDPGRLGDALYLRDDAAAAYVPLDMGLYADRVLSSGAW